jgi:MerR family transcriptional regulator, redox-sensitive transcriptional activator SoxR
MGPNDIISIGDLARRTGLSVSSIRFYEERGLVEPFRSSGGQRRFLRSDIRRLSFIRIAQQLGLSIEGIGEELRKLPHGRTPTAKDWANISAMLKARLDDQIWTAASAADACRSRTAPCIIRKIGQQQRALGRAMPWGIGQGSERP